MTLLAKLVRGSTLNLAEQGLKLALVFFITPLMIEHLGERDYGIWLLAMAIVAYLNLLDLGVSFAGSRFLARAVGSGDDGEYQTLVSNLFVLYRRIAAATLPVTVVIALLVPLFLKDQQAAGQVRSIVLAFGGAITVRFFLRIYQVILKSHVRYDLIAVSTIIKTILQGGGVATALLAGKGLTTLLIIHISLDLLDHLLLMIFARRVAPDSIIGAGAYDPTNTLELVRYSGSSFALSASWTLRSGIDPLVIGRFSGLDRIPVYNIGVRFFTVLDGLINAIFGGNLIAAFSQIDGRDGPESVRASFLRALRLSSAMATIGIGAIAIYGPSFIERWVGPNFSGAGTVLHILALPMAIMMIQFPVAGLLYSLGKQHTLAIAALGSGGLNLVLSLILAHQIGFFGVVWATFIEMILLFGIILPFLVIRSAGVPAWLYAKALSRGCITALVPSILWFLIARGLLQADYLRLAYLGAIHFALAAPVIWWGALHADERRLLLETIPFIRSQSSRLPPN